MHSVIHLRSEAFSNKCTTYYKIPPIRCAFNKNTRTKRGKKKSATNDTSKLEIYYNNVNGLLTKQDSLCDILEMQKPDVLAMCETKLHANSTFDIAGYKVLKSNLKAGKEGILVAAKKGTFNSMEMVFEAESKQIATVEIGYPQENLRVTVVHGPQEKAGDDEKEEFFVDLHAEVQRSLDSNCKTMVLGDFNARLEHHEGKILTCKGNGERLKEMVEKYELKVMNIQPDTDGRWTRIQKKGDQVCKSVLDYIIMDGKLAERAGKTTVDEDKLFTPYRTKKCGTERSIVFSDHCAMMTSLEIVKGTTRKRQRKDIIKCWKLTEEGMEK